MSTPVLANERFSPIVAVVLGLIATFSSAIVTVLAGQERGGSALERTAWTAIGLTLLLSVHFLPTLSRGAALHIRLAAGALWLFSLLATGYTHATFFINAQKNAGQVRAERILVPQSVPSVAAGRTPDEIARDRERAEGELANARQANCSLDCKWLMLRRTNLAAKLVALNIEFDEARHREHIVDDQRAERAKALAAREEASSDPVSVQLAHLIHVREREVSLGLSLLLGLLLEIVASMCWLLAFHGQKTARTIRLSLAGNSDEQRSQQQVTAPVQPTHRTDTANSAKTAKWENTWPDAANESEPVSIPAAHAKRSADRHRTLMTADLKVDLSAATTKTHQKIAKPIKEPEASDEELLAELVRAIRGGEVRSTLNAITRHLGCNEGTAMALRSRLVTRHPDLFCELSTAIS